MKKFLPFGLGLAALLTLAYVLWLPHPASTEDIYVPTIYSPGGTFLMPIGLDEYQSINGLRRLEEVQVKAEGTLPTGEALSAEGLQFNNKTSQETWGEISVASGQSHSRKMEHAFVEIVLPQEDRWRGVETKLTVAATLVFPEATVSDDKQYGYVDKREPIQRDYTLKVASAADEADAKNRQAQWDTAHADWTARMERWESLRMSGFVGSGVLLVAAVASFLLSKKR